MVFSYEDENDNLTYNIYRISWILILAIGSVGIFFLLQSQGIDADTEAIELIIDNFQEIIQALLILSIAALVVGWLQVGFAAKIGEELILLVTWLTPIALIGVSLYMYLQTEEINVLGGTAAGIIALLVIIYFRKSLRLSARLVEVGAEITATNPSLFIPQLTAFLGTLVVTILMVPAAIIVATFTLEIHPYVTVLAVGVLMWMYSFVVAAFQSFADASNISYVDYWYTKKSDPSLGEAADHVKKQKAPIARFAFLMAFVNRFRRSKRGSNRSIFRLLKFSNWKNVLFSGRSVTSTAASAAAYFGSYTLVVLMVENIKSVATAYKESAKTVFERFFENVAGRAGFNILESFRKFLSSVLMFLAGGIYGFTQYDNIVVAIIFAILFLAMGFYPINAMFKPAVNAYKLILYRSHTGDVSDKLDEKTKSLINEVF